MSIPQANHRFAFAHFDQITSLEGVLPEDLASRLAVLPGFIWLDSANADQDAISLLGVDPVRVLRGHISRDWGQVESHLRQMTSADAKLGQLLGPGLYGWVAYDGNFVLGDYRQVLVYHHGSGQWHGSGALAEGYKRKGKQWRPGASEAMTGAMTSSLGSFAPLMDRDSFVAMVERAKRYIAAGDIYQVNLSYPWQAKCRSAACGLPAYLRLRTLSPAPYAAFLKLDGMQILSSSPELFLRMSGRDIATMPIKGTRPRVIGDPAADARSRMDLLRSAKERAELLMITDLERNDLGQVCEFGSVRVPRLWQVEAFAHVFHLVSTVQGRLAAGVSQASAFAACFPGGSITGAPKKRAMEIIAELEPHARGVYTGAIGGFSYHGESRWNIAIRTAVWHEGMLQFQTGAGIVADSDPQAEFEETLHKAAGLLLLAAPAAPTPVCGDLKS